MSMMGAPFSLKSDQDNLNKRPWGSREIGELIAKIEITPKTILDIGFGKEARSTKALSVKFSEANIVAIDNNYYALDTAITSNYSTDKLRYVFGDPEIALPKQKFDLVTLCMACHSFSNPYRALSNLLNYSAVDLGSYVLFIHRTDDFMRAISGLLPLDPNDAAANEIYKIWNDNSASNMPYQLRMICEHEQWFSHFMMVNGFVRINDNQTNVFETKSENVREVLEEKRYSPLKYVTVDANNFDKVINTKVQLEYYLYKRESQPLADTSTIASSFPSVPFSIAELPSTINPLDKDHEKDFQAKMAEWFKTTSYMYNPDDTLRYGFYIDKRLEKVGSRQQLWPDPDTELLEFTSNIKVPYIPLIDALSKLRCLDKKNYWSLLWVLIPNMECWFDDYESMHDILDRDYHQKSWQILPYTDTLDERFIKSLKKLEVDNCSSCLTNTDYSMLATFLSALVAKLKEKKVVATYYMLFIDSDSPGDKKFSFSVHTTRWLNVSEIRGLSHKAKSALAAINSNINLRQSAKSEILEKHSQMLELLQAPLRRLTEAHRQIQEDTQELRAILYEPIDGIFAVQNEIAELFGQGKTLTNPDKTRVVIEHQPGKYRGGREVEAKWILAHALSRFRGDELRGKNAQDALEREIEELQSQTEDESKPLYEYAKSIGRLFDIDLSESKSKIVADSIDSIQKLEHLKNVLFTPFKPDKSNDDILWSLLSPLLPSKVYIKEVFFNDKIVSIDDNTLRWVVGRANPFATQGHLLMFVCRFVTQHLTNNKSATIGVNFKLKGVLDKFNSIDTVTFASVSFESSANWIDIVPDDRNKLISLLKKERTNKKNGIVEMGEHGDFHLPFVTLIRRYPLLDPKDPAFVKTKNEITISDSFPLRLTFRNNLTFIFDNRFFTIESTREEAV